MTIGSLCSGYGGLDIGLQSLIGGDVRWHFEYDKHASKILKTHYPDIPNYGDITTTDWDIEPVDWITAGYPCQPFSTAGQRKGTNDARHIWPYIANAIRILRPRGVLLENVAGHLSLGFGHVLGDLAQLGYDTQWVCIRAADAGAPHSRRRVFIAAHTDRVNDGQRHRGQLHSGVNRVGHGQNRESRAGITESADKIPTDSPYRAAVERWEQITGRQHPAPLIDNRLNPAFAEWMMGIPTGWVTDVGLSREAQLHAIGNGVVPQQAALALRLIGVAA